MAPQPGDYVDRIIAAAAEYRIAEYDRLAAEARQRLAAPILIRDVYSPVLHEAGERWERGLFSVVQEHMLTSALRRQLTYALDEHTRRADGPLVAFTTLSGERHELGSLMLAVLAASRGVRALYLGPDLPVAEVGVFCARVRVDAVAISIVTSPEVIDAVTQLVQLRAVLPPAMPLWVGGQAAVQIPRVRLPDRCICIDDVADFERRLVGLKENGTP